MNRQERIDAIRTRLSEAFSPELLEIVDESDLHEGHASAGGGGHYRVRIRSAAFAGKSAVQRHRMVYAALGELMGTEIHALGIQAE